MFGFKKKQEPVSTSVAARVEAGAAVMDSRVPGWADQIDLDRLDLSSNYRCVLGQTYGSYTTGALKVFGVFNGSRAEVSREHGFDAHRALSQAEIDREFAALTEAWRKEIQERRDNVSA